LLQEPFIATIYYLALEKNPQTKDLIASGHLPSQRVVQLNDFLLFSRRRPPPLFCGLPAACAGYLSTDIVMVSERNLIRPPHLLVTRQSRRELFSLRRFLLAKHR